MVTRSCPAALETHDGGQGARVCESLALAVAVK